jgi:hypothetical protein
VYYIKGVTENTPVKTMDIKEVAKEIRIILKNTFLTTKFSVTCSRFSQGSAVYISWTDGPTTKQVNEMVETFGTSSKFIETTRMHSNQFVNEVINTWKNMHPRYAHLELTCKGNINCYAVFNVSEFNNNPNLRLFENSVHELINHSIFLDGRVRIQETIPINKELEAISNHKPELIEMLAETVPQSEVSEPQVSELDAIKQSATAIELTVDYVVAVYHSYSCPERKNDEPEYFSLDKWRETVGQDAQLTGEATVCLTSWNSALERMTITAICCNLPETKIQKLSDLVSIELDALEADRQQAYAQYLASQQEGDELESKLAVKKTEAQLYFAMMKEIEGKIEAKKREAEVISPQAQPDFDVRTLESKKVTLILINTMGVPVCRHITVIAADIVSAKRYYGEITDKKCLEIQYIEKGKRKPKGTRYTEASLAVALGWQDIKVPTNNGYIDAFDNGLLDAMIRQAKDVVYTQQGL